MIDLFAEWADEYCAGRTDLDFEAWTREVGAERCEQLRLAVWRDRGRPDECHRES